jgi:hypothetical protein
MEIICNIIPVIILAILILYPTETAKFVHSILGRLFAIILILFYSSIHVAYGVIVCILFILYYRNTAIEGFEDAKQSFREQNCKNGTLLKKGSPVNLEMLEHIHTDINFKYEKCNPCSDICEFSIIDEQIKSEESLKPKTADDFSIDKFTDNIFKKISDFIPALWVKSEPFALLE